MINNDSGRNTHGLFYIHALFYKTKNRSNELTYSLCGCVNYGKYRTGCHLATSLTDSVSRADVWESGSIAPPFLASALGGGERPASRPGCFTPKETAPGTHCTGGWVGPRASLDDLEKEKSLALARNRTPAAHPVALCYSN
jgi:hypothetical protein